MASKLIRPPRLQAGSRVALVAPAFSFDAKALQEGRENFEKLYGVKTVSLPSIQEKDFYLAGSDQRRREELLHWLRDPSIHAIIAVRGGYGVTKIYPDLIKALKSSKKKLPPKIVAGFSDITILLNGFLQDLGWATFHSPHVVSRLFKNPLQIETDTFTRSLFKGEPLGRVETPDLTTLSAGKATAPVVGGCLSLVVASLGTSYEVQTDGKILFLEDVTERSYRLDRMLTQLLHAGKFNKVKGVIIGQMTDIVPPQDMPEADALAAIGHSILPFLRKKTIPCVYNFPAGHGSPQVTFPIGVKVSVNAASTGRPTVEFLEAGVR